MELRSSIIIIQTYLLHSVYERFCMNFDTIMFRLRVLLVLMFVFVGHNHKITYIYFAINNYTDVDFESLIH